MTEPPQPPPNQPPPPSGYGHLPGPPQPGYGYPPPGGNPYAQQPPTVPQPPVQPGGYGFPPPPGGRRKGAVLVAAAAVGVLVLGAGAWFVFGGDDERPKQPVAQGSTPADPKPSASVDKGDGSGNGSGEQTDLNAGRKPGEDKALWLKTVKLQSSGSGGISTRGQWVVGDTIAKTIGNTVVGYGTADGKEKWKIDVRAEICGIAAQATADGKTVVIVKDGAGSNAECNQLKQIDLKAGKEGWTKEVVKESLFGGGASATLSLTGDTVVVNRLGGTSAYRVSTGDKLFSGNVPEGCQPTQYAAGRDKVLGIALCMDADRTVEVQDADPVTGKKSWAYRLPKGWQVNGVYSVFPAVLDIGNRDTKERAVIALTADGKKRSAMAAEGSFAVNCGSSTLDDLQGCGDAAVDGDTLYLMTDTKGGDNNEIVAFDLATGKPKWRRAAGDKRSLSPLKAAGGQLIAYHTGALDQPGEIISIPVAGGTPTTLLRLPSGPAAKIEGSFMFSQRAFQDGRFFLSVTTLMANSTDEKFLMAFGK
ncbi:PQQ-binding-like beta-propeller repeat protein [Streptomyces katrae]|uniref:outer membrane protein assembly factor BamB family protein n=1 Tax=Streptomyces katrae TaxID=68223 RepID=UPI0009A51791|nr:PQQ-binding-like beta-propeller repeat protein [Streptomyces katrae]